MRHIDSLYTIGATIESRVERSAVIGSIWDTSDGAFGTLTHLHSNVLEEYVEGIPLVKEYQNSEFISWILLFTVIYLSLLALLRIKGRGILSTLFSSIFRRKKSNAVIESKEIRPNYLLLFLSLILSLSSIATLIVFILKQLFIPELMLTLTATLIGYHLFLLLIIYFLGWLFNNHLCAVEVGTNLWVFNSTIGIAISPLVLALFYLWPTSVNILLFLIVGVLIIYYIFRITRWVKILFEHRVSIFYIILYLCALEILPLLLAYHYGGTIF